MFSKPTVKYILSVKKKGFTFAKKSMSRTRTSHPLTESEGFAHLSSYYQSGLRPREYYKNHGISEYQFYHWRKRYLAAHPELCTNKAAVSTGKKQFHEVKFAPMSLPSSLSGGLEIHYPHGVKVVFSSDSGLDLETLSTLIQLKV
jgi:hypothetical protein